MSDSKPVFIRTESTFQHGVTAFMLLFVNIGFWAFCIFSGFPFFYVVLGVFLVALMVNLFLSRQKIEIDVANRKIIRTQYPLFFPIRIKKSITGCNRITIYYTRSSSSGMVRGVSVSDFTEFCEIQFRRAAGEPICLVEFPDHKSAAELAGKLSQWLNLPVEDLYLEWLEQTRENRERRRRAGFR